MEDPILNHNRACRTNRESHLYLRNTQKKYKELNQSLELLSALQSIEELWHIDLVHDQLPAGRLLRPSRVIDDRKG